MSSLALRGLLIIAGSYVLVVVFFLMSGIPAAYAIYLGGTYALTALASFLMARGILEIFVSFDRDAVFFRNMKGLTDPLIALVAPITPGFLVPFATSLFAAFLYFFLKLFLFGDGYLGVPPLFILAYLVLMSIF
jgi:hypothetical protein